MVEFLERMFSSVRSQRVAPTKTIGVGGTAVYGGYVDNKEINQKLIGQARWKTFSELLSNVSIVASSVRYYLNLLGKATWTVVPPKDSGQAGEDLAELIDNILFNSNTPWSQIVRRAGTYRTHGYSIQEWTAMRREDGSIGLLDIEPRAQWTIERWDIDTTGTVHGAIQRSPQTALEIYLPRTRLVYVVDDSLSDSPEGLGILRHVFPTAERLQKLEALEVGGFETDLEGIPVAKAPYSTMRSQGLTDAQIAQRVATVEEFIQNRTKQNGRKALGLILDSLPYTSVDEAGTPSAANQWEMELLSASSSSQEALVTSIQRMNREIARNFGTEGLLLGETGAGSLALSKDKTSVFSLMVDSSLSDIRWSLKRDLIDSLFVLNGWDPALKPDLRPEKIQHREISEVTGALDDMARAGAVLTPDDPAINAVRELLGLPEQIEILDIEDAALNSGGNADPTKSDGPEGVPSGADDTLEAE